MSYHKNDMREYQQGLVSDNADSMQFITDGRRHLVCIPYSIANLHAMAERLGLKRCWFHSDHYDIPKRRINEIEKQCEMVTSKQIVQIIKNG